MVTEKFLIDSNIFITPYQNYFMRQTGFKL